MAAPQRVLVKSQYAGIRGGYTCIDVDVYSKAATKASNQTVFIVRQTNMLRRRWAFVSDLPKPGQSDAHTTWAVSGDDAPTPELAKWPDDRIDGIMSYDEVRMPGHDGGGQLWIDPQFPHDVRSIGRHAPGHMQAMWVPCRKLGGGRVQLFDGIDANGLLQGQVGNCWLVAAMACLANFPESVKDIFRGREENVGRYTLRLYDTKQRKTRGVVIDEYIPCHPQQWYHQEHRPLFARCNGNEMWCLLLEKAMAKMMGSYEALNGNAMAVAFRAMTGETNCITWDKKPGIGWIKMKLQKGTEQFVFKPLMALDTCSGDILWEKFKKYDQSNYLMGCDMDETHGSEYKREDGLVEGHAYSVHHAMEVDGHRLVCLRNPWGDAIMWNGPWSDHDRKWREFPGVANKIRPRFVQDGMFWMAWDDFERLFTGIHVCCKQMRTGSAAQDHAQASMVGTMTALDLGKILNPQSPIHHGIPPARLFPPRVTGGAGGVAGAAAAVAAKQWAAANDPEGLRARANVAGAKMSDMLHAAAKQARGDGDRGFQALLGGGGGAGGGAVSDGAEVSDSPQAMRAAEVTFIPGEDVEYFSVSQQIWISAKVLRFDEKQRVYDLDCRIGVPAERVRARRRPKAMFSPGEQLEYYSESQGRWIRTNVVRFDAAQNTYDLTCKVGVPVNKLRKPQGVTFAVGEAVLYYSESQRQWVKAVVRGYNKEEDTYDLDIKLGAIAERVRRVTEDPAARALPPIQSGISAAGDEYEDEVKQFDKYVDWVRKEAKRPVGRQSDFIGDLKRGLFAAIRNIGGGGGGSSSDLEDSQNVARIRQ
uniref:Calpain catalytic domain-containing protein n=1 Tax=Noctiluca scintillans TaxID=2966 RepID=A0A7S1F134_NOCSC|mmetsp:Transcript_25786/g.67580  ORF Transcript_25786/g.67580 Transcript_25786/m.67580 type:complete len:815 (+) Transcript_25786:45-2489(+)